MVYIISKGRPQNVQKMEGLSGGPTVWMVSPSESAAYVDAGAVVICSPEQDRDCVNPKAATMNRTLDMNRDDWTILCDDDLQGLIVKGRGGVTIHEAARMMVEEGERYGASLVGVLPYSNVFYSTYGVRPGFRKMLWLFAIAPGSPFRFDETLRIGEDYEYTAKVHRGGGIIVRHDDIIPKFQFNNPGSHWGYGPERALEHDRCNRILMDRYPDLFLPTIRNGLVDDLRFRRV